MKPAIAYCKIRDSLNTLDRRNYQEIFDDISKIISQVKTTEVIEEKKEKTEPLTRKEVTGENRQEKTGKDR